MTFKVLAHRNDFQRGVDIAMVTVNDRDQVIGVVDPLILKTATSDITDGYAVMQPVLFGRHGDEFMQSALDAAWRLGYRPTKWHDEKPGEIARMERHLADMREIVSKTIKVKLP